MRTKRIQIRLEVSLDGLGRVAIRPKSIRLDKHTKVRQYDDHLYAVYILLALGMLRIRDLSLTHRNPQLPEASTPMTEKEFVERYRPHAEPLNDEFYHLGAEEAMFFKTWTGIHDEDKLKRHILEVQRDAYKASEV